MLHPYTAARFGEGVASGSPAGSTRDRVTNASQAQAHLEGNIRKAFSDAGFEYLEGGGPTDWRGIALDYPAQQ
jgi:hypothetical protein